MIDSSEYTNKFILNQFFADGKLQTRNMNYYYLKTVTPPSVISTSFSDDSDTIVFDLTSVYPVESLLSLIRTNIYNRTPGTGSVVVEDTVKFSSLTNYEFGIPSRNGVWTELSVSETMLTGMFTVGSSSINVTVSTSSPFTHNIVTKTLNGLTYTRLGVSMVNPILEDTISVTYS